MKVKHRIALLLAAASMVACATPASTASSRPSTSSRNDVISADQMRSVQATNLFEAVQRLHPEWLMQRNASTFGAMGARKGSGSSEVQVFMGGQHVGGTDMLRQLPLTEAGSLHYYTAAQSESKFGSGFPNGVIEVLAPGKS